MRHHTLIGGIRNKAEKNVAGLRTYEQPTECKVFDAHGNLIRIEQPFTYQPSFYKGTRRVV